MPTIFLTVPFTEKDAVKKLGARWHVDERKWYIPDNVSTNGFEKWLPTTPLTASPQASAPVAASASTSLSTTQASLLPEQPKGRTLTDLLGQVASAIAGAFPSATWIRAEISELKQASSGHIYITLVEHDDTGKEIARVSATIWSNRVQSVVTAFCKATGADFGPGIKVLLNARVAMSPRGQISLNIESIDPTYTLGELEAKLKRIRVQLTSEGLIDRNKSLPIPKDFFKVIVISPEDAAGLGDFKQEAERLQKYGITQFDYRSAVFQGENASQSVSAIVSAVKAGEGDAVVIIRGGGAVSDLHWLSDYAIAKAVCLCPLPVLVGIGHEKDSTILDEVACKRFGTPSKVIGFVESTIRDTWDWFAETAGYIVVTAQRLQEQASNASNQEFQMIAQTAKHAVEIADHELENTRKVIVLGATAAVPEAERLTQATYKEISVVAEKSLTVAEARQEALISVVKTEPLKLMARLGQDLMVVRETVKRESEKAVEFAAKDVEQHMRTVLGMGPERTLKRGFALAWGQGRPITSRARAEEAGAFEVEFRDGRVAVDVRNAAGQGQ